jgi:xanthine dehydrogenase accessory factor
VLLECGIVTTVDGLAEPRRVKLARAALLVYSAYMAADAEAVYEVAKRWFEEGRRVAWATVVETWSSSPRPVGSQMVIADDGRFAGSISGGCVESAVIQAALDLFGAASPASKTLAYGVSTEQAWDVGLPCGGKIEVFLGETPRALLTRLSLARRGRSSSTYLTDLAQGTQELWEPGTGLLAAHTGLAGAVAESVRQERSRVVEGDGRRVFVHVLSAPLRLVVVGAVHLTQALAELSELSGFELIVIDPRTAFATSERFPRATLLHDWPDVALSKIEPDARTAIVTLSHDAKLDEPALVAALQSDCFYIGALGSQRTQQARRRRLGELGFDEAQLARIHGPVGLDIGALTTAEIAIAIMAQIIQARRQRPLPAA